MIYFWYLKNAQGPACQVKLESHDERKKSQNLPKSESIKIQIKSTATSYDSIIRAVFCK